MFREILANEEQKSQLGSLSDLRKNLNNFCQKEGAKKIIWNRYLSNTLQMLFTPTLQDYAGNTKQC